jgi:NADPH2:quinone reductase
VRAIQVGRFGGADELRLTEVAAPIPAAGELLVKVGVAGINFIDIYMRSGFYSKSQTYQTQLPMTIGMEAGGIVAGVGAGVTGWQPDERVAYAPWRGAYAEYATVPAWKAVHVPDALDIERATALMLQGYTAHYLSHSAFALQPGQTCLVHAAAGGVGQLLVQLAKIRGATVIATVGTEDKAAIARARGADHVILYRETDFREEVMRITGGVGVHVVYDSVGRDTIARSIRSLRRRGACINYGGASGLVEAVHPLELAEAGSVWFTRPHLADYLSDAAEITTRANDLFGYALDGRLGVTIDRVLPLDQAAQAHRILEGRETRGKLLLRVDPALR